MDAKMTLEIAELFPVLATYIAFENGYTWLSILRLLRDFGVVSGEVHVRFHLGGTENDGSNAILGFIRLLDKFCVYQYFSWFDSSRLIQLSQFLFVDWFIDSCV